MTFSSRLFALPNPMFRGLVPVSILYETLMLPDRSGTLLPGQLVVDNYKLRVFCFVENGEVVTQPARGQEYERVHSSVQLAVLYFGSLAAAAFIDKMVGPLRTWDDFEAADSLIREMGLLITSGRLPNYCWLEDE